MKEKPIIGPISFESYSGNHYIYSPKLSQVLLSHPLLNYFFVLEQEGTDLKEWINNLKSNKVTLKRYGSFSKRAIKYYYGKYQFLKENNFFSETGIEKKISKRITPETIKSTLANLESICFEVTDACNLECLYCAYGKFYKHKDERKNKCLSISLARNILEHLDDLRNSYLNIAHKKSFLIGFYGGEPLLNFEFIEKIVQFARCLQVKHNNDISFGMTTNGVLLHKYMDFLVKNGFHLCISLDGDEKNNGYRVFPDGKPSYKTVFRNIRLLKTTYPDYFKTKVTFNAVLHNKNSISGIHKYFKENFDKFPNFSEIGPYWIEDCRKKQFNEIYRNSYESINRVENYSEIEKDMFTELPNIRDILLFIHQYSAFVFKTYNDFFISKWDRNITPTGTCIPFQKKMYMSVNGKILPCENIGHQNYLDIFDEQRKEIDTVRVAERYNKFLDKMAQCNTCCGADKCDQCMFNFINDDVVNKCAYIKNRKEFTTFLSKRLSTLEERPGLYPLIMDEVVYE